MPKVPLSLVAPRPGAGVAVWSGDEERRVSLFDLSCLGRPRKVFARHVVFDLGEGPGLHVPRGFSVLTVPREHVGEPCACEAVCTPAEQVDPGVHLLVRGEPRFVVRDGGGLLCRRVTFDRVFEVRVEDEAKAFFEARLVHTAPAQVGFPLVLSWDGLFLGRG